MSEDDARRFYVEIQAATGLLMLHTYDDLGLDISCLADSYFPLYDLRFFFRRPEQPEEATSPSIPDAPKP